MKIEEVGALCREMYEARATALRERPRRVGAANKDIKKPLYKTADMCVYTLPIQAVDVFLSQMDPDGSGGWGVLHAGRDAARGNVSMNISGAYVKAMADHIDSAAKRGAKGK